MTLRQLRRVKGFQRQFVALKVEVSGKHLNDIEAGKVNLTGKMANKLSSFYGIAVEDIEEMYKEARDGQCKS